MASHHEPTHKPAKHAPPAPFTSDELKALCEQWLSAIEDLSQHVGDNNTQHFVAILKMLGERDELRERFVAKLGGKG